MFINFLNTTLQFRCMVHKLPRQGEFSNVFHYNLIKYMSCMKDYAKRHHSTNRGTKVFFFSPGVQQRERRKKRSNLLCLSLETHLVRQI